MREKIGVFSLVAFASAASLACSVAQPQTRAEGFGSGATGGSEPCRVSAPSQAALEACTRRPGTLITFAQPWTIVLQSTVNLSSDQTLRGPAHIEGSGIVLQIADQSNVVIQGMTFSSAAGGACSAPQRPQDVKHCGIPINVKGRVTNVWIDHNLFTHCGEKCVEIWNEARAGLDPSGFTPAPDLITVSNNRFAQSYFCMAVGISAATPNSAIRPNGERVTVVGNTFDGCFRRSVRAASGADVHEVGNLIERWGPAAGSNCEGQNYGFGPSAVGGGEILLERNTFVPWPNGPCKEAVDTSDYDSRVTGVDRGRGFVRAIGNQVVAGATITENNPGAVFTPPYRLNRPTPGVPAE
jgi:pectate lyase